MPTRLERSMAILTVLIMRMVQMDDEDSPDMPGEIADWADPVLWKQTCISREDRRM